MFGFFAKKMTEYSHHYLDWSRLGELLKSGKHRYTTDELRVRGNIVIFTAVSAFLAAYLNDEEKTQYSDINVSLAAALLGFTVSHTIALYPLIKKRLEMKQDCLRLIKEIELKMHQLSPEIQATTRQSIQSVIEEIIKLSLSTNQHAKASQTWGHRKQLLSKINDRLKKQSFEANFWQENPSSIIQKLENKLIAHPEYPFSKKNPALGF